MIRRAEEKDIKAIIEIIGLLKLDIPGFISIKILQCWNIQDTIGVMHVTVLK